MPTASDLVTDLPADFEVFGQAVDTSLADLKGGTTGQILSKASNTDMDFTWTAATSGDITGVSVTSPITGGGTSGDVTIGISSSAVVPSQTGNSGKYLTTDGTTSSWGTISAGSMTLLSTTSMSGVSTVTISSISQSYNHLQILIEDLTMTTNDKNIALRFNSDTGSNYMATFDNTNTNSFATYGGFYSATPGTNDGNNVVLDIPFYTNTTNAKMAKQTYLGISTTGAGYWRLTNEYAIGWKGKAAISSITIYNFTDSTTFSSGSIKIYGVK
jgi:hypothetical protein